jgi:glutamate racemase
LLIERLRQVAPWPVNFIDPASAIARRVNNLLGPADLKLEPGAARAIFTSGRPPAAVLARFDIDAHEPAEASGRR